MSDIKITIVGAMGDKVSRCFIDAWHRAERGEAVNERHLAFESWDACDQAFMNSQNGDEDLP